MNVSTDTISRVIKRDFNMSFAEFREQNMVHTRRRLVRTAIREATKKSGPNTAMLIFCLKNMCGWKDKFDVGIEKSDRPLADLTDEELDAMEEVH